MPIVETRLADKQPEIPLTVLPDIKNVQQLFVTLDFKPLNRFN